MRQSVQVLGRIFELCIEASHNQILRNPKIAQVKYNGVRIKYIERFPFGIHYFIDGSKIKVIGIFHTGRDPQNWSDRL
jgi:hypothetical protein